MKTPRFRATRVRSAAALVLVIAATLLFASVVSGQSSPSDYPPPPPSPIAPPDWDGPLMPLVGDANLDGSVTMADTMVIMQHRAVIITLSDSALAVSDTNNSGDVTMADVMHIMQYRADPGGGLGILSQPLWEWPDDAGLRDPLGQNAG